MDHIVVVGGGQAGASLVAKLRGLNFQGKITLIGAEPELPYQRPPLSKAYLLGEMERARLLLRPANFYQDQNIEVATNTKVVAVDPAQKSVTLAGGDVIAYDGLALTTGSWPRRLPGAIGGDLGGVFTMRSLEDANAMAPIMQSGKKLLVVGGGYIGLEAAAVAAKKGLEVTVVEMADRILQRVAAPETSDFFRDLHQSHGVTIREGLGLARLLGDLHVTGAEFTDGTTEPFDFVVVGVGIAPGDALAQEAGLDCENGIKTDAQGRTSDPAIWAAGDCASFPWRGERIRLESVPNAIEQAELVAENMLGAAKDYDPKIWFWSDQYDVKLQIAGLNTGYDHVVTRPGAKEHSQSHWYYRGDKLLAVDAMNDPRAYMIGKRMIEAGKSPAAAKVENPDTDLKALLA